MDLAIQLIEKYCEQNGWPINIRIDIHDITTDIRVVAGGYDQNGSRAEYLSFQDLREILEVNDVIGKTINDNSLVKEQLDFYNKEMSNGKGDNFNRLQNVESLIYDTLAKYIIQMLHGATLPRIFYPEIIPLQKHKATHFTELAEEANE